MENLNEAVQTGLRNLIAEHLPGIRQNSLLLFLSVAPTATPRSIAMKGTRYTVPVNTTCPVNWGEKNHHRPFSARNMSVHEPKEQSTNGRVDILLLDWSVAIRARVYFLLSGECVRVLGSTAPVEYTIP